MALSKIDVANMLTGVTPVANGGTALSSGFTNGKVLQAVTTESTANVTSTTTSFVTMNFNVQITLWIVTGKPYHW